MSRKPRFTRPQLEQAIAESLSWAETLRRLQYKSAGGNWKTLKKYAELWEISADHFEPYAQSLIGLRAHWKTTRPLEEVLVEGSTYSRASLKQRLYDEGLKKPECEMCGQGEEWRGTKITLIIDHINGIPDDNRLENLRIVCPNCASTLDTHCGRRNKRPPRTCARCEEQFQPKTKLQKYCSRYCGSRASATGSVSQRRCERPPYKLLIAEIEEYGYLAVGRKYGVSDNAVRKWVRFYERERAIAEGSDPEAIEIPTRTWPNQRSDKKAA